MDIIGKTIRELSSMLAKKEVSSKELTKAYLSRIDSVEAKVNAFITLSADEAMKAAEEADKKLARGIGLTRLTGIPISVKDIFCTKGIRTTCASKILENFIPPYESTVTRKLREAGAVILGKNNMDEFAMGSSTENSAYKKTKNPWALDRVPGGSSGGSAAAVAAGESAASVGTDTGGSIRQPASCCGIVGMKPTYGRVSRYGMIAFASSLDQAGPLTLDVEDSAIMLNAISGYDEFDSTSVNMNVPNFCESLIPNMKGLKVGIPKEYFIEGVDKEVEKSVNGALDNLKRLGAELVSVSLPHTEYAVSVYYLVATAEASSNLARFDGVKYGLRVNGTGSLIDMYKETRAAGFGSEVKRRIMLGTYSLSAGYYDAYYKKASEVRTLIKNDFDNAFKACDVIATPTAPTAAFKIGERIEDPLTMYLSDIFTISCNLAGIPGISVPCGFTGSGLPIGLQILGRPFDEGMVLRAAYAYEQSAKWKDKRAAL